MLLDRAPQVLAIEVGVDFGREDAFVPQHLLHLTDRGAAFQQVRRERVAEGVVVNAPSITDAQRAQIEDIVKRKAEVGAENIIITLLNLSD